MHHSVHVLSSLNVVFIKAICVLREQIAAILIDFEILGPPPVIIVASRLLQSLEQFSKRLALNFSLEVKWKLLTSWLEWRLSTSQRVCPYSRNKRQDLSQAESFMDATENSSCRLSTFSWAKFSSPSVSLGSARRSSDPFCSQAWLTSYERDVWAFLACGYQLCPWWLTSVRDAKIAHGASLCAAAYFQLV